MSSNLELFYGEDKGQPRWFRLARDARGNITAAQHAETLSERPMIVGKWSNYESLTNLESVTLYQMSNGQAFSVAQDMTAHSHSLELDNDTPKKDPADLKAKEPVSVGDELDRLNHFYHHSVLGKTEAPPADFNKVEGIYFVLKADDAYARVIKTKMNSALPAEWLAAFNAKVEVFSRAVEAARTEDAAIAAVPPNPEEFIKPFYLYRKEDLDALMSDCVRASFEAGSDWASKLKPNRHAYYVPAVREKDVTEEFLRKELANYLQATKNLPPAANRAFGFEVNYKNEHWTNLTFDCKGYNPATKKYAQVIVTDFDSAGSHLTPQMLAAIKAVYGDNVVIKHKNDRGQPTSYDCGPLSVNNLKKFLQEKEDNEAFTLEMVAELRRSQQAQLLGVSAETQTVKVGTKTEHGVAPKLSSEWLQCFQKVNAGFKIEGNKAILKTEMPFGQGAHQKNSPVSVSVDANGLVQISLPKGQLIPKAMLDVSINAFIMAQLKKKFPTKSAEELDALLKNKDEYTKHIKFVKIDADDASVRQQMAAHAKAFGLVVEDVAPEMGPAKQPMPVEEEHSHVPGM